MPFRNRRRTYQREWRFLSSLSKIRDEIAPTLRDVGAPLSRLSVRGERILAARAIEKPGVRYFHEQDRFVDAVRIARRIAISVEELTALIRQLEGMAKY